MKVVIDIKEETYNLIRETIAFWRSDEKYTVAPIGWQEIADSKPYEEQPQGEWIIQPHSMIMKCSLCGHEENAKEVGTINSDKHFCSNCGADMRGGENE